MAARAPDIDLLRLARACCGFGGDDDDDDDGDDGDNDDAEDGEAARPLPAGIASKSISEEARGCIWVVRAPRLHSSTGNPRAGSLSQQSAALSCRLRHSLLAVPSQVVTSDDRPVQGRKGLNTRELVAAAQKGTLSRWRW